MSSGWLWNEDELESDAGKPVKKRSRKTDLDPKRRSSVDSTAATTPSPAPPPVVAKPVVAKPVIAKPVVAKPPVVQPPDPVESLPGFDPERPLSISQLNQWIKGTLESSIPTIWLEGEISDLSQPSSGHVYLTLKDRESQIRAVMWRSVVARTHLRLEEGLSVLCCGSLDVYGPRGTYQFVIQKVQPQGMGAMELAFKQLFGKLEREGMFDPGRKRMLPKFPRRIGFVTSPSGAAVHDFLQVLRRRWQGVHVMIIPSKVQGEGAASDLVKAIRLAGQIEPPLDVLVVGRGGGSKEDLWCFNEEPVVRALAASPIPTVSAVGHEVDVTLCDYVADVRALTPTEAAERILPDAEELRHQLATHRHRMNQSVRNRLFETRRRIELIASRPVLARPLDWIALRQQRVDELQIRYDQTVVRSIELRRQRLEQTVATLEALNPLRVVRRGYGIVRSSDSGAVLSSVGQIEIGAAIETELSDGVVTSRVEAIDSLEGPKTG